MVVQLRDDLQSLQVIVPGLYPSWRKNQLEVIEQVHDSLKQHIAIQAPTGFGKSASAAGSLIAAGDRGIILTLTKQLGDQYYRDFFPIGLKTVKGRGNFQCALVREKTADVAPCVAGMKCSFKRGGCDYYDQKREAVESSLVSMNIKYFLYEANYGGEFTGIKSLFIDEAHKLEDSVKDFIEVRFSKARFREEGQPLPTVLTFESLSAWVDNTIGTIEAELEQVLMELEEDPHNDILTIRGIRLSAAKNALDKFELVDSTWVIDEDDYAIILKPVWVGKYLDQVLYRHAEKTIFMSATLPRSVLESLNIIDYDYINLPSSFDSKSRPVIWVPAANLARSAKNPMLELRKLTSAIDAAADKFSDKKGIIHTVNYRISEYILENSRHKDRIVTHKNAQEREQVLNLFKKSDKPLILVSPSFTDGIDLPYDECRWQCIAKIPYDNLGDKQVKARANADPQWYATSAIVTLIQAYGRIMRADDDHGVTYIFDSSLMYLINNWRVIFDQVSWFLDALLILQNNTLVPFNEFIVSPQFSNSRK